MTTSPQSGSLHRFEQVLAWLVPVASGLAVLVASVDLIGWALAGRLLIQPVPLPGAGIMMPNTAMGFALSGAALWLLHEEEANPRRRGTGRALALITLLLGGLTLSEYILGVDLGLDRLLFSETVKHMAPGIPGRPSPLSALGFCLTGLMLLLMHVRTRQGWRPARLLALAVMLLCSQVIIGYVYLEENLFEPERLLLPLPPSSPMVVHPALLFLLLSLGLLSVHLEARHRSEEVLRDSEERFRTSFEHAPIGMALVGLDGQFLNVNGALCDIVGYSQKELLTKKFRDITYPEDVELDLENGRRLLRGEINSSQSERRYVHKDGHLVTILLTGSMVRDSRGRPLYFIVQIQDISERKQLEKAWRFLAEAGPRLAASLEPQATLATVAGLAVPALADWCMIDLFGDDGQVQWVEIMAASPEKSHLLHEMITAYPHDLSQRGDIVAHVLRTGQPALVPEIPEAILEATARDSRHLELLHRLESRSSIVVPLATRGRILGVIILTMSESGRRYDARDLALAEELAHRAALAIDNARFHEQSEQATRIRDEVLRVVAHDLRTPLNVISLCARKLLTSPTEKRTTDTNSLESIQKAVDRATRLIQDLMDVARMKAGHLSVDRGLEQTAPLVKEAAELHRALAEEKSIQLTAAVAEDAPPVFADRDRVIQILSNLLGNALKFTPVGGRISLRAEPAGHMMRFSVSDTGSGIPMENLPHLFEPFWQSSVGKKQGAGLGLAIVKGLVDAHGGRVWVESKPGRGSTFFFTLPTSVPAAEHSSHHA